MTLPFVICALAAVAALFYIFYLPGKLYLGPQKTRASFLRERKEMIYENLRDLNFEFRAGKYPEDDYLRQRQSLESEAAGVLTEMDSLGA